MPACPCCGGDFSRRQISRHMADRRRELEVHLDGMSDDEELFFDDGEDHDGDPAPDELGGQALDQDEPAPDYAEPALAIPDYAEPALAIPDNPEHALAIPDNPEHALAIPGNPEPAPNDAALQWPDINLEGVIAQEAEANDLDDVGVDVNDMDLDDEGDLFVPPPVVPPAPAARRNAVIIEDWASDEEDLEDLAPPGFDNDELIGDEIPEPAFHEDDGQQELDPEDRPDMNEEELWAILRQYLGDLAEQEWLDMYNRVLTDRDRKTLMFLAARLRTHFSRDTYNDLRQHACEELGLPSDFVAWRRLKILSQLESRSYDCCVDSCICFVGKYRDLERCPYCDNPRFNVQGKPRRSFHYTPLIPQLVGLFQNPTSIGKMRHRARHDQYRAQNPGKISDIFDGELYQTLRATRVFEEHPYRFFESPDDIALGLGTDGFSLYKRRHKGESTAWPLILVNYNLHPSIRYRLENIICVGVIPGPKECKDINSFLVPLIEELIELASGVETSKVASDEDIIDGEGTYFILRAFLIILFGDIPAISKLLMLKGHNAITPCRSCLIQGTQCQLANTTVYYVPLTAPNEPLFPPAGLVPRSQMSFIRTYEQLEAEPRVGERARIAQTSGLNGRPLVAELGSIDLSSCAPYELMHLIFENLVPNMVNLWKNKFKWLNEDEAYHIDADAWKAIGKLTAEATRTIPAQFVGTLPDIDKDMNLYKAEAYSFWFTYLAPIVLNGRLNRVYYRHFLSMREIVLWCLQIEISHEEVDALERKVIEWVQEYERLYYRYEHDRLPTCVLTIHALLHMPRYIRRTGPLPGTWSFVMERFCGYLLRPALANRVRPYDTLDNFIRRRAQMQIVALVHNMPGLVKPVTHLTLHHGELISTKETIYEFQSDVILGQPVKRIPHPPIELKRQMTWYFGVAEGPPHGEGPRPTYAELIEKIDLDTLVRYGRFRLASMGDRIRTADIIRRSAVARDNSYIRYEGLPDANARFEHQRDRPVRQIYYARVMDVYYVEFVRDRATNNRVPYLLARVQDCNTGGLDASKPDNPLVTYNRLASPEIINLGMVQAAVGRIKVGGRNTWAIVDRSRGARTQFNNDAGVPDPELE